jgi:hypothetical protein
MLHTIRLEYDAIERHDIQYKQYVHVKETFISDIWNYSTHRNDATDTRSFDCIGSVTDAVVGVIDAYRNARNIHCGKRIDVCQ